MVDSPKAASHRAGTAVEPPLPEDVISPKSISLTSTSERKSPMPGNAVSIGAARRASLTTMLSKSVLQLWKDLSGASSHFTKEVRDRSMAYQHRRSSVTVANVNVANVNAVNVNAVNVNYMMHDHLASQRLDALKFTLTRPVLRSSPRKTAHPRSFFFSKSPNEPGIKEHFLECEKNVVQGIESGQGVYQFVSRKAHFLPAESDEKPIIDTLLAQWKNREPNADLILGGRFNIVSIIPSEWPPAVREGRDYPLRDQHRTCELTVIDMHLDANDPKRLRSIPLTQVGLKFTDKLLREAQIADANQVMIAHLKKRQPPLPGVQRQSLPIIASAAKRGRGPTLIVFHEILARIEAGLITDKKSIDNALAEIILTGRQARIADDLYANRTPDLDGFVHSAAQLQELRSALRTALKNKNDRLDDTTVNVKNFAAEVVDKKRFHIRPNAGGPSCLFHALAGNDLGDDEIVALRNRVADVIVGEETSALDATNNAHALITAGVLEPGTTHVTNADMAALQRNPTNFASQSEIKQWLALEENRHTTVVWIGAQSGQEELLTFFGDGVDSLALIPSQTDERPAEAIKADTKRRIATAIYGRDVSYVDGIPVIPKNRIVLYANGNHIERLTGIKTNGEAIEFQKRGYRPIELPGSFAQHNRRRAKQSSRVTFR